MSQDVTVGGLLEFFESPGKEMGDDRNILPQEERGRRLSTALDHALTLAATLNAGYTTHPVRFQISTSVLHQGNFNPYSTVGVTLPFYEPAEKTSPDILY